MSQKNVINLAEMTSRNSSSEESGEKKGRTTTHQKITLPIFEKKTIQEAKLWWRRFIQYVKMTQKIDLNRMTSVKEILEEYREELEIKMKDLFIWALGEEAVTEMTTSRERPKSAPYLRLKKIRKPFFLQLEATKAIKKLKIEKKISEFFLDFFFEVSGKPHSAENVRGDAFFHVRRFGCVENEVLSTYGKSW